MADFSGALSPISSPDLLARRGMASPSLSNNVFDTSTEVHKEAIARPHVEILSESQIKGPMSIQRGGVCVKCLYTPGCMLFLSYVHSHTHLHKHGREEDHGIIEWICHVLLLWQNNAKWPLPHGNYCHLLIYISGWA